MTLTWQQNEENINEQVFTIETRLNQRNNKDLIDFLNRYREFYGHVFRVVWHIYKNHNKSFGMNESKFTTYLCNRFDIVSRVANSIVTDVKARYKSMLELQKTQNNELKTKIKTLTRECDKLKEKLNKNKEKARDNQLTEKQLQWYRNDKLRLYALQQRINKSKNRFDQRESRLKDNIVDICFGTKKLFKAQYHLEKSGFPSHKHWKDKFHKEKNKNILIVGDKNQLSGNGILQLAYNQHINKVPEFSIKLRDFNKPKKYYEGICTFKHKFLRDVLCDNIVSQDRLHGVTYRFVFRGSKCYLQALIIINRIQCVHARTWMTRSTYGVIGLDFNSGHIDAVETDRHGNIVDIKQYKLKYHGSGNKADNEVCHIVKQIVQNAQNKGKDIVQESLNFQSKKGKTKKSRSYKGKDYNTMLHTLDYARFEHRLKNCCFHYGVYLIKVNPAYTTKIAKQKYCEPKKLVSHQGAAYVIARRGQGFKDVYYDKSKNQKIII